MSPRSYNTCYKGYVVDVFDLDSAYTGSGNALNARLSAQWGDSPISNQADCEGSQVAGLFYEWTDGSGASTNGGIGGVSQFWSLFKEEHQHGHWLGAFGGCSFDVSATGMTAGRTYRIAATARTPGGRTRKVSIGTYKKVDIY